jgi:hypothetical protein
MLKLESTVSIRNVSFDFTKEKKQEWEVHPHTKGCGESRADGIKWIGCLMSLAPLVAVGRLLHTFKGKILDLRCNEKLSPVTVTSRDPTQ